MRGYKIIHEDGQWYFELYPHRPKDQPIGRSRGYGSNLECVNALRQFRDLVRDQLVNSLESPFIRLVKTEDGTRVEYCVDGEMIFASRFYTAASPRGNCKNIVVSIYRNLPDYTQQQLY